MKKRKRQIELMKKCNLQEIKTRFQECSLEDYQLREVENCNIEKIKKAINEANRRMLLDNYISLTELYSEIGLKPTSLSDSLGWNVIHGYIEPEFSSQLADDGTPCMVVDYKEGPYYNFDTFA